ncbi:MAG: UDP-3-O-(3-hydroxymyristoyl)glucosamine N-acyltransferase [Candidatus Zixiibacteriota bacterium]
MLLADIAKKLDLKVTGNGNVEISGVNSINNVKSDQITFLRSSKYAKHLVDRKPGAIILREKDDVFERDFPKLYSSDPEFSFLEVIKIFHPQVRFEDKISDTAIISKTATIGTDAFIGAFVSIGDGAIIGDNAWINSNVSIDKNVKIGNDVKIHSNVTIYKECEIGDDVTIHANSVIGSDGFGYLKRDKQYKIPQLGNVIIGNDVEIGSNVSIDRATFGSTIIEDNVKIDNLVQIAHNCKVGESTAISAQVGLSGHTVIGKDCLIGGQVGFAGHLKIGDESIIYAQSGIAKSFPPRSTVFGTPGKNFKQYKAEMMAIARLPRYIERIKEIDKKIKDLE